MADPSSQPQALVDVSADEFLFDLKFGMSFDDRCKSRDRAAQEVAIETVARMIQAHLDRAGYVIKRKPPASSHSTGPSYKAI
jgi:hypothetical protein